MAKDRFFAFNLNVMDIMTDEKCLIMDNHEFGAYMRLLFVQWKEISIPKARLKIIRLLHETEESFDRIWPQISPCFDEIDGERLQNKRMERERSRLIDKYAKLSQAGVKGGQKSKRKATLKPGLSQAKAKRKQNVSDDEAIQKTEYINTPLTPLGEKRKIIYDSWNFHMSKLPGYGTIKPGKTSDKLIDACLKGCHDFPERYKTQAYKFRQVDDSGWTTGKVSFHWTLRQTTIDKLEAGGYRMKGENTTPAQSYGRHPDDCSYRPKEDSHDN